MPVLYLVEPSGRVANMSFNVDDVQLLTIVSEWKGTRKGNHFLYTFQQILSFMSIFDKERSTTGKKIWLFMHLRKFDSHVTERRPPNRPQHRENKSFLASVGACNLCL